MQFERHHFRYTALFCEENIWQLGRALVDQGIPSERLQVLFLSNAKQQTPLLYQQVSVTPRQAALWDYHVILKMDYEAGQSWIFDFDSRLPFPSTFEDYIKKSFILPSQLGEDLHIHVRQIPLSAFFTHFDSDRSHMCDENGSPLVPFPNYPPIRAQLAEQAISLSDYMDMNKTLSDGSEVFNYAQWWVKG